MPFLDNYPILLLSIISLFITAIYTFSVAAVEDDKFYGQYAEEAFRLFLDKRRKEKKGGTKS
jgi:hypothetical protein